MDEPKRIKQGIKLNASQAPLKKTGDFVIGGDKQKLLTNKILENLNNRSNAGYFSEALSRSSYKNWSVSREFEMPQIPEEADAHMKMIEGASASEPLQNENQYQSHASEQPVANDPFFMGEPAHKDEYDPFFMQEGVQSSAENQGEYSQNFQSEQIDISHYSYASESEQSSSISHNASESAQTAADLATSDFTGWGAPPGVESASDVQSTSESAVSIVEQASAAASFDDDNAWTRFDPMPPYEPGTPSAHAAPSAPAVEEPSPWGAPVFDQSGPAVIKQSIEPTNEPPPRTTPNVVAQAFAEGQWGAPTESVQTSDVASANPSPAEAVPAPPSAVPPSAENFDGPAPWESLATTGEADNSEAKSLAGPSSVSENLNIAESATNHAASEEIAANQNVADTGLERTDFSKPVVFKGGVTPAGQVESSSKRVSDNEPFDSRLLPDWMSQLVEQSATIDSESAAEEAEPSLPEPEYAQKKEGDFDTFVNSIPDEEFMVDNNTLRGLFKSLVEPKRGIAKTKPGDNSEADLKIAAAAAEILKSQVEIDDISMEEIASDELLESVTAEVEAAASMAHDVNVPPTEADQEAIQQAYAMLDLTPIPQEQRKEGLFDTVFDTIEQAATPTSNESSKHIDDSGANIFRTQRGTIELAMHANGRQLIPQYNQVGMLTSVQLSDGIGLALTEKKDSWEMTDGAGKVMQSGITSVSFDKQGNLSYVTKGGDTVTLRVDGTINTKFAPKKKPESDSAAFEQIEEPTPIEDFKPGSLDLTNSPTQPAFLDLTASAEEPAPTPLDLLPPAPEPTVSAPMDESSTKSEPTVSAPMDESPTESEPTVAASVDSLPLEAEPAATAPPAKSRKKADKVAAGTKKKGKAAKESNVEPAESTEAKVEQVAEVKTDDSAKTEKSKGTSKSKPASSKSSSKSKKNR